MKRLMLVCMALLIAAAMTAPAQALPACFKFCDFCDGIDVNSEGIGGASWYHWDCANNSPMDAKRKVSGEWVNNCPTDGPGDRAIARSVSPNGPGDYYFVIDLPLDGDVDMHAGTYPNGSCWIDNLCYLTLMGECTGIEGQANRSTTQ